jgi:hypothetical protein
MIEKLLRHPLINGWGLFWLISIPMCLHMVWEMSTLDISKPQSVSHMIGFSVRWSIPFICMAIAASSMPKLFPGHFTRWWGRHRKHFGLLFAVAMAWQGLFIFIISTQFRDYYFNDVYLLRDEMEGSIGYIFMAFMVLTSFQFGRRLISPSQWKLLHTLGICFLWAYPYSVYWWNMHYYSRLYDNMLWWDYVFYAMCTAAFWARIAAFGKTRQRALTAEVPVSHKAAGGLTIAIGLVLTATGTYWQDPVSTFVLGTTWSETLLLWLPFWPFEPFIPLILLGIGTWLYTFQPGEVKKAILADPPA